MSMADILALLVPAQAWAAGGGEHHAPSIHDIWFPLGNFLIYALIIVKFALPLVRDFLKSRREEVVSTIAQASAKKQQAQAFVSDYQAKIAGLNNQIQTLQAALRDEGEREKSRLVSEAQSLALKIKDDTQFLADQEVKIARQQLRQEMASQAEAAARALVQRHLSAADQNRLADEFIQSIGPTR
ncbi:MAG: H+transporting two-sector ATPase subunit [Deltaproteobacteria bacterium]|nr:H+transporting two-sector ATPase subunit [Deltaproteobacteria bacterium]